MESNFYDRLMLSLLGGGDTADVICRIELFIKDCNICNSSEVFTKSLENCVFFRNFQ